MTSPVTVTNTPVIVAPINPRRVRIFLQNTGTTKTFFKKQSSTSVPNIPSATNYDFILWDTEENGIRQIEVETTSGFNAITATATPTTIAVFETVAPSSSGCR